MATPSTLSPRKIGAVNWQGLWTLTRKETERFLIVAAQTIVAPVVTTLLFYLVFNIALGGAARHIAGIPYMAFLAPGLVMMSMAQNAFANTSSSLVISKVQGNIVDVLMPPLSVYEFAIGFVVGGVIRGLLVGLVSILALVFLLEFNFHSPFYILFHAVMGSMMMALLGFVGGIWSQKFDHLATVTNFIIMPATFLSGTFTPSQLAPSWQFICHLNPFFYMIDGFRYGFTGLTDGSLATGVTVMLVSNAVLWIMAIAMLKTGYKLKS